MEPISTQWAADVLNAQVVGEISGDIAGVSTDTRTIQPGALFFALVGENSDGHEYVKAAFAKGAVAAVVSNVVENAGGPQIVVPDTLRALGDLAMHYRRQFNIPVVGITGSVGKTSTKEMVAAILRTRYNVLASAKNFNNEIGVPLTLFQLDSSHEVAVIEMGMRGLGEIDRLAEIAQPTIGLITNIGYAHIERLGSQENIAKAKAELYARLPKDGIAVMPYGRWYWKILAENIPSTCKVITFKSTYQPKSDLCPALNSVKVNSVGAVKFEVLIGETGETLPIELNAVGVHHVGNAVSSLAVAIALGIPLKKAIAALENWHGAEGRMVVRHTAKDLVILDDCYNAGPESMSYALQTLKLMEKSRVAVLGDMRELGEFTRDLHYEIGAYVFTTGVRLLVTVGEASKDIAEFVGRYFRENSEKRPNLVHFDNSDEAAAHIRELVRPGDVVLVKGSRAMQMEKIVAALTGDTENLTHG